METLSSRAKRDLRLARGARLAKSNKASETRVDASFASVTFAREVDFQAVVICRLSINALLAYISKNVRTNLYNLLYSTLLYIIFPLFLIALLSLTNQLLFLAQLNFIPRLV